MVGSDAALYRSDSNTAFLEWFHHVLVLRLCRVQVKQGDNLSADLQHMPHDHVAPAHCTTQIFKGCDTNQHQKHCCSET
ncbi:hypothetical protein XFEB_01584 [Xylella fastidiosa EB92.1]|nr:hypothetical protein XFEB_01584 [Xylella fastidiosa EB92.1]